MTRVWCLRALAFCLLFPGPASAGPPATSPAKAPDAKTAVPDDFKLMIELSGVRKKPVATAELVVRKGVAYQFIDDSPEEVVIIDPGRSRVVLLDISRDIQTEVSSKDLDVSVGRIYHRLSTAVAIKKKSGDRSDRVAAEMTRNLIDPRFAETFDPATNRLRLTNPTVEVEAVGAPEPDAGRLTIVLNSLAATTKLGALREPDGLPPFPRLDALRALSVGHKLRPTEITYLYRMAGPPRKLRWTYRLVTVLTDREREAITRVERMRGTARFLRFDRYETPDDK